jgi:organic radical activating enzyme
MKSFLYKTHSVCNECYKHIDAEVYEQNNQILMDKHCPTHGVTTVPIMNDSDFYHSLTYNTSGHRYPTLNAVLFEVTNRCNLACPDCYQLPDNRSIDKPAFMVIDEILSLNDADFNIVFAGAEPTLRKDIVELLQEVQLNTKNKFVLFLTNGVRFSDYNLCRSLADNGLSGATIGLNHWSYQGQTVHSKQLQGIKHLNDVNCSIDISYTAESYDHLTEIIREMQYLKSTYKKIQIFRLRFGSNIGRTSSKNLTTLSDHFNQFINLCNELGLEWFIENEENNIYHVMINVNGVSVRLIQWPDVTNINMHELKTGPWCKFYDGPVTNFVHQVIMRDISVNKKIILPDTVPYEYTYNAWKART